jgi:uncharacterized GH25 family protein
MKSLAVTAAALLFAAALQAHDFWIEPSTFHPQAGMTVSVGLRVGQNFVGDPVPRNGPYIERFVVKQGRTEEPIDGMNATDPAGWFTANGRAAAVIAYASKPSFVELPAAKFEDYRRPQGLERIVAARAQRGERARPGREIFSRCAQAILTGTRASIAVTQPLGLRYEIVPRSDPTFGGAPFRGRVVYQRTTAPGMLVEAVFLKQPSIRMSTRSDAEGNFSFALPRAGVWLIKSVQMIDAPRGSNAEWESLWASLTFDAPPAEGRP